MTPWHADDQLLGAYAEGRLDRARAASVEQHVTGCARCRAAIAPHADPTLLARAWTEIGDRVDRPRVSLFERVLIGLGLSAPAARLAAGASAARRAWVIGCVLVAAFALLAQDMQDLTVGMWFLTVAPLAPLTGVALAYGPGAFPMHDVAAAAPYPRLRLILLRCLPVVPMTALLLLVGGAVLPYTAQAALWLLPGLALAGVSLIAEPLIGAGPAIAGLATLWVAYVVTTRVATGSTLSAFSPAVQLLSLVVVLAVAAVTVLRTRTRRFP
ncbi:zf-HC2 domain-containing protein [Actinoplanes sp. KI2]|uniref:zf-HC2 domain-containing protein n=1 Tax=Actinoplanes sp. KI2 TaxID=2983315 RepID=UPI0021D59D2D|nr:zf-HC2 domain-containing protein [Actinoplanes sp. KI2]MCU7725238.1 zf-HC2 domain-containing protein [Actinoplanes sp. KI2]